MPLMRNKLLSHICYSCVANTESNLLATGISLPCNGSCRYYQSYSLHSYRTIHIFTNGMRIFFSCFCSLPNLLAHTKYAWSSVSWCGSILHPSTRTEYLPHPSCLTIASFMVLYFAFLLTTFLLRCSCFQPRFDEATDLFADYAHILCHDASCEF